MRDSGGPARGLANGPVSSPAGPRPKPNRFRPVANCSADCPTIQAAQARGECNPDIDARLLLISLIGLTMFPHAVQGIWRALFDARDIDADLMVRHTLALLERGMEFSND
jgi:hypothetical protein